MDSKWLFLATPPLNPTDTWPGPVIIPPPPINSPDFRKVPAKPKQKMEKGFTGPQPFD